MRADQILFPVDVTGAVALDRSVLIDFQLGDEIGAAAAGDNPLEPRTIHVRAQNAAALDERFRLTVNGAAAPVENLILAQLDRHG
jgi:hypothetical protein